MSKSTWERQVQWFEEWPAKGSPVVVLEGFSGVGKSWLARKLAAESKVPCAFVSVPQGSDSLDDLLLDIAGELQDAGINSMADRDDFNLYVGLEDAMRQQCLVIIDNLQELLGKDSRLPPSRFLETIQRIAGRPANQGRLLLVTDESMPEGRWRDNIPVRKLPAPPESVGVELLESILEAADRSHAIPLTQREEVVRWLGGNPRAMQVLVGCLADDSLEDLIKLEPELWDMRSKVAAPRLVQQLEERFLSRTISRLDSTSIIMLEMLSIYRRPFDRDAITRVVEIEGGQEEAKRTLISRFVLELNRNWYSLNPLARQIGLRRLRGTSKELAASDRAASHYARHFVAQRIIDPVTRAAEFVEARHHLIRSGRGDDFEAIARRYRSRLINTYGASSKVPDDRNKIEELIHLLAALLDEESLGYSELRYFLAKLLIARGKRGDDRVALAQIRLAVRDSQVPGVWILCMRLSAQVEGISAMRAVAKNAYLNTSDKSRLLIAYAESKMLGSGRQYKSAFAVVESELARYSKLEPAHVQLVQLAVGLLLRDERYSDAFEMSISSIRRCDPAMPLVNRIVESGIFPALARADSASIRSMEFAIPDSDNSEWMRILCRVLVLQCSDRWDDALEVGAPNAFRYPALQAATAFSALVTGDLPRAETLFHGSMMPANAATEWLGGVLALASGKTEVASSSFGRSIGRPLSGDELTDPNLWLKAWDRVPDAIEHYPAFYFPRLPAALTGLPIDLVRHETSGSALKVEVSAELRLPLSSTIQEVQDEVMETRGSEATSQPSLSIVFQNQISPNIGAIGVKGPQMNDTYNIGQAAAAGRNSRADHATFNQVWSPGDAQERERLLSELGRVRRHLSEMSDNSDIVEAVQSLESASRSIEEEDYSTASGYLARAGHWALGAATTIGAGVATAAIKAALGV